MKKHALLVCLAVIVAPIEHRLHVEVASVVPNADAFFSFLLCACLHSGLSSALMSNVMFPFCLLQSCCSSIAQPVDCHDSNC